MQIKSLKIDNHLCLVDFSISFATVDGGSSTILIGENGTGKSTMLDAVLEIFMSFDSPAIEKRLDYNYEIKYEYAQTHHEITKDGHRYRLRAGSTVYEGSYELIRTVMSKIRVFPQRIVAFYSGANNKLVGKIHQINNQYAKKCRATIRFFLESQDDDTVTQIPYFPKRKYNYCDEAMTPIYLASILAGQDSFEKKYLQDTCHLSKIEYVDVCVNLDKVERLFGNDRFEDDYPSRLYYLTDFIDHRFTDHFRRGFKYTDAGKGYFTLSNLEEIDVDSIAIFDFFEKLHSLFGAQYEVTVPFGDTSVKVSNLSEGQRQLIKMLGMLGVCKNEDCLVLMDEPDAHMNPRWKYEIKPIIDECLKSATNTQAIIATHDPLVINGVDKEFIRLFSFKPYYIHKYNWFFTQVIKPTEDTEGLGIDGLLQSEYYGLRTSYDKKATDKFIRRQELYSKLISGDADEADKEQLRKLTKELGALPMSYNSIDFLYDDFIRVYKNSDLFAKEYLSYEDIQRRGKRIKEIINALYEGQV